ncbi:MAG: hypothetical protein ACR2JY_02260 [Chloroflexota bacterium]
MVDQAQHPYRWVDLRADGSNRHNPGAPDITPDGLKLTALR